MTDDFLIRRSQRAAFIRHQVNLRQNHEQFLSQLKSFVIDNMKALNSNEDGLYGFYIKVIEDIENKLSASFKDQLDAALPLLQKSRRKKEASSLGHLLEQEGYKLLEGDERLIAKELKDRGFIDYTASKEGISSIKLTPKGIMHEGSVFSNENEFTSSDLLREITQYLDLKFANLSVLTAISSKELADLVEDTSNELSAKYSVKEKKSLKKIVWGKVSNLFVTEALKKGMINPTLEDMGDGIMELASGYL